MTSFLDSKCRRRNGDSDLVPPISPRTTLQTFPPERHAGMVRIRGGLLSVPGKLKEIGKSPLQLTKLLLNVTIEGSLGPVHVVMASENTVGDLAKAVLEIYVREKRRPLLMETDPRRFELHYSQFSLQSLKAEEKLINLCSRNFYLRAKPVLDSAIFPSYEQSKMAIEFPVPFTDFMIMDFVL